MGLYPASYGLADNATIKEINAFKKRSNWGEIPAFFNLVASSVAEVEGFMTYGFDNAYKNIVDRRNWNYQKLGMPANANKASLETVEPLSKPQVCLLHVFSASGYELLAFPYVNDKVVDDYKRDDPNMGFTVWDPSKMKYLVKINQLHKFIAFTINSGDDADMALIIHAHLVVDRLIHNLSQEVDIVGVKGTDIKGAFSAQKANPGMPPEDAIIATQMNSDPE